jgi:tetratricopeptide (TPR) repeat protein
MVASPEEARRQAEAAGQQQQQQQQQSAGQQIAGPGSGITTAGRPALPGTFEQFREMAQQVEPNPQRQAVLEDMRQRLDERMGRAEDQRDTAKYDAILAAGLAMMGGNSMADGLARAAQMGGATYFASRKDAENAINAAEDAELSFRQYELALEQGDRKEARDMMDSYLGASLKLFDIDQRTAAAAMRASGERRGMSSVLDSTRFEGLVDRDSMVEAAIIERERVLAFAPNDKEAIQNAQTAVANARNQARPRVAAILRAQGIDIDPEIYRTGAMDSAGEDYDPETRSLRSSQ